MKSCTGKSDFSFSGFVGLYSYIASDVRKAVDICHTDGYIKTMVMKNPSKSAYEQSLAVYHDSFPF